MVEAMTDKRLEEIRNTHGNPERRRDAFVMLGAMTQTRMGMAIDELLVEVDRLRTECKAPEKRIEELEKCLRGVIRLEQLIAPNGYVKPEHLNEAEALCGLIADCRKVLRGET